MGKTRLKKTCTRLGQKIKVRQVSGSAVVETQVQMITRWSLQLMKHSRKEAFSKELHQKIRTK